MKVKLGVFFGGKSVEHDISIITACQAMAALDRNRYEVVAVYQDRSGSFRTDPSFQSIDTFRSGNIPSGTTVDLIGRSGKLLLNPARKSAVARLLNSAGIELDVVLPAFHGTNGEDGLFQGHLESLGVPYCGCGVAASAIGMDKALFKCLLQGAGLPVLPGWVVKNGERWQDALGEVTFPVIVKPTALGSSIGVNIAHDAVELTRALELALEFSASALVEPALLGTREINCSVMGIGDDVKPSVCEEPMRSGEALSFEDKYLGCSKGGKAPSQGMASTSRQIPAGVSGETESKARELAVRTFARLGACGVARVDFLLGPNEEYLYVNEINTIPGSFSFYLWEATGLPFADLLDELVRIALLRQREKDELRSAFATSVLQIQSAGKAGAKGA